MQGGGGYFILMSFLYSLKNGGFYLDMKVFSKPQETQQWY